MGKLTITRFTLLEKPTPMGGETVLATAAVEVDSRKWSLFLMRTIDGSNRVWWRPDQKARIALDELTQVGGIESAIESMYEDERINIEECAE
jgi:hypothetical protein